MKAKILVIATATFVSVAPLSADASSLSLEENVSEMNQKENIQYKNIENNMDSYINQLEEYVILNADGTITLDSAYENHLYIPDKVTDGIEDWIGYLNELVIAGKATVHQDLSVSIENVQKIATEKNSFSTLAAASGRSGVDTFWWGYNVYLNSNETRTVYQSFLAGGSFTTGASVVSRYIPIPPTQLVSAISGVIGGGMVGFGDMIRNEHEGNGVRIRFTGLGYAAVPTGVFPQ